MKRKLQNADKMTYQLQTLNIKVLSSAFKAWCFLCTHTIWNNDTDILEAITWHTTGHPDMTMLEKIVFVADYIEPYRNKAANLDKIRYLAFTNIDDAILHILNDTINYLKENDKPIDGITLETYNFYKNYSKSNITIERNNKYHDKRYFKADGKNYRRSIKRKKRL